MIEFYHKNFKKSYKRKVDQLIKDLERLIELEGMEIEENYEVIFSIEYRDGLSDEAWEKVNKIYFTLNNQKRTLSNTLKKFLMKTNSNDNRDFRFIDTFAGCGGLSKGLSNAGFNPVLINEIEPKFLETYYLNHDLSLDSYFCGDIKELVEGELINEEKYNDLDLVVGGPPCQGFSMANRQRLLDDPRNELYKQFLKLLGRTRPKFFIMENVKGMMNKVDEILDNFKSVLGEGYSMRMILLNARNYGVPQNRERVFVIGTRVEKVNINDLVENIVKYELSVKKFVLKDALKGLPVLEPKKRKE